MGMGCHGEPGAAVRSLPAWQTGEVSSVPQPGTVLEAADRNEMEMGALTGTGTVLAVRGLSHIQILPFKSFRR